MISISMGFGQLIKTFIATSLTQILSACLLMALGCWLLLKSWLERKKDGIKEAVMVFKWQIPSLGIAVQILCEPDLADADASGIISPWEAFYLGIALALDAFGAGLAFAMAGFSITLTMLTVGLCQCIMLVIGINFGKIGIPEQLCGKVVYIPGIILLLLGIWKIT
jgi:putative sporulation protein YtaF